MSHNWGEREFVIPLSRRNRRPNVFEAAAAAEIRDHDVFELLLFLDGGDYVEAQTL